MAFADHFSNQADDYARYRPGYPPALFAWLAAQAPEHACALDVATGSGQAAGDLTVHFETVIGCEPSLAQLHHAESRRRLSYVCSTAEQLPFRDRCFDLITVAQAVHWFDHALFNREAGRLLKPGGVLAVWGYGLFRISEAIDAVIQDYYANTLHGYWPAERHWIEQGYAGLPFPFAQHDSPAFAIEAQWNLTQVLDYLSTWSATQRYLADHDHNPLTALQQQLLPLWGNPEQPRPIHWPIHLLVGHK